MQPVLTCSSAGPWVARMPLLTSAKFTPWLLPPGHACKHSAIKATAGILPVSISNEPEHSMSQVHSAPAYLNWAGLGGHENPSGLVLR